MSNISFYNKYHSKNHKYYKTINDNNFTYYYHIEALRKINPNLSFNNYRVLDIGCGVGALSFYLASKGAVVDGIDISSRAISICNAYKKEANIKNVHFINADVENLDAPNKYDLIICSEVIEHVNNDVGLLRSAKRLLKPKGLILLSTPSKSTILYKLHLLDNFDRSVGHLRRYTESSALRLAKNQGLRVVYFAKTESILRNTLFVYSPAGKIIRFIRGPLVGLFHFIDKQIIKVFGESNLIFVLQK